MAESESGYLGPATEAERRLTNGTVCTTPKFEPDGITSIWVNHRGIETNAFLSVNCS